MPLKKSSDNVFCVEDLQALSISFIRNVFPVFNKTEITKEMWAYLNEIDMILQFNLKLLLKVVNKDGRRESFYNNSKIHLTLILCLFLSDVFMKKSEKLNLWFSTNVSFKILITNSKEQNDNAICSFKYVWTRVVAFQIVDVERHLKRLYWKTARPTTHAWPLRKDNIIV